MTDKLRQAAEMALEALEDVQEAYGNTSEWFRDRVEALRQALAEPDKHIKELRANLNRMRHFQEWGEVGFATGERIAGYNAAVDEMLEHLREMGLDDDTGIDRGAWSDVPDATKWVDDLRGDEDLEEPPNSTTDVVEPVAWIVPDYGFLFPNEDSAQRYLDNIESNAAPTPLYTAPPKREWQGLTDE